VETKEIKELIEAIKGTDFNHIEIKHEGTSLLFQRGMLEKSDENKSIPKESRKETTVVQKNEVVEENYNLTDVKSPLVGTYYESSSPEAEPYVKVGDKVKKGDVLCIIEAMKLMNEIESEVDGEIAEILIDNEAPIEYGQVLFRIK
jgi:acetyl-CoA carboxylase biotin carboxyl carrier protein